MYYSCILIVAEVKDQPFESGAVSLSSMEQYTKSKLSVFTNDILLMIYGYFTLQERIPRQMHINGSN
jgi:hypothetical protein